MTSGTPPDQEPSSPVGQPHGDAPSSPPPPGGDQPPRGVPVSPPPAYPPPAYPAPSYPPPAYPPPGVWAPGGPAHRQGQSWPQSRFRPLGLGELLDAAFTLYRRNFVLIAAIAAVLLIPSAAVQYVVLRGRTLSSTADSSLIVGLIVVGVLEFFLLQPLIQAAITRAVSERYLDRPAGVGTAYRSAALRLRSLIAASLELLLLTVALFVPAVLLGVVTQQAAVFLVLAAAALPVALLVGVRMAFAAPAIVIEGVSGWAGLGRSWRLTRGSWWRIFGIVLLVSLLVSIMGGTISGLLGLPGLAMGSAARVAYQSVIAAVVGVFVTPIRLVVITLLYYDLRIRREAFDIEMLAASL